jgi:gamma-glutamylcysteine synthetase
MKAHAGQCSWHCDQYEQECDCGAARPATIDWAEREVSAVRSALGRANERLAIAQSRLREIAEHAQTPPNEHTKGDH